MALAIAYSRAVTGIHAPLVTVETHLSPGNDKFQIVGLPAAAVKESRDRVRSALLHARFHFPDGMITVNLAPADLPKEGGRFDLPIALGILAASHQLPAKALQGYEFSAELALSGELRPIRGALPMAIQAAKAGHKLILPFANAEEAGLLAEAEIYLGNHLLEVVAHLSQQSILKRSCFSMASQLAVPQKDFAEIKGQMHAKRAMTIAAAGRHSLLLLGPPGTGKTMLASRLPSILPALGDDEAIEAAAIATLGSEGFQAKTWKQVPFRAPHHTSSSVAMVGGGRPPRPGEISLAHHGVLFLDELPEYARTVLECLREPLESGHVTISRAAFQSRFPASFQLIAAMNPCPCGYAGSTQKQCYCRTEQIKRYRAKISGPLLDRIDMQIEVAPLPTELLLQSQQCGESSAAIKAKVVTAQARQYQRQHKLNALLSNQELRLYCHLELETQKLAEKLMTKFNLSARAYHRILKLARTIADLEDANDISATHFSEAMTYRCLDREN